MRSTSAVDHFDKTVTLRRFLQDKRNTLEPIYEEIAQLEETLRIYRDERARPFEEDIERLQEAIEEECTRQQHENEPVAKKLKTEDNKEMHIPSDIAALQPIKRTDVDINPQTGLPVGEKIQLEEEAHEEYIDLIRGARQAMYNGNVEGAIAADNAAQKLPKWFDHSLETNVLLYMSSFFDDDESECDSNEDSGQHPTWHVSDLFQCNTASFLMRKSIPTDEDIQTTLHIAKKRYKDSTLFEEESMDDIFNFCLPTQKDPDYNLWIMRDIKAEVIKLEELHESLYQMYYQREENEDNHDDNDEVEENGEDEDHEHIDPNRFRFRGGWPLDNDNQDDDEEDEEHEDEPEEDEDDEESLQQFKMNRNHWDAVELAIRDKIDAVKILSEKELELPSPDTAPLARFNPKRHFQFDSDEAKASLDKTHTSLLQCKMPSRPIEYKGLTKGRATSKRERRPLLIPVEGDELKYFDVEGNFMTMCGDEGDRGWTGVRKIPSPSNLDSAQFFDEVVDESGSHDAWDKSTVDVVHPHANKSYTHCVLDTNNDCLWASDTSGNIVARFISSNDETYSHFKIPKEDINHEAWGFHNKIPFVKCGDTMIATTGKDCIFTWSTRDIESQAKSLVPNKIQIDAVSNFYAGEIQYWQDSKVAILGLEEQPNYRIPKSKWKTVSRSPKLFDVAAEKVVGLFCGMDADTIDRQHCQNDNLMFFMKDSTGIVCDTRIFQPVVALHTNKNHRILGVSTNGAPVAFTYGNAESIMCWDLRKPCSHVYSMATGNTEVNHLCWHEETTSLFASTWSKHRPSFGYCEMELYGERYDDMENHDKFFTSSNWPKRAEHEEGYFGRAEWNGGDGMNTIIQYIFQ